MNIDLNKYYYHMGFRGKKKRPDEIGLIPGPKQGTYLSNEDHSLWEERSLYDFGWGNEEGYMRLPQLAFDEAWYLLANSTLKENKYGAATIIEEEYPDELLDYLVKLFSLNNKDLINSFKEALKILKLNIARNRSKTIGKDYKQVNSDFEAWNHITEQVLKVLDDNLPGKG